MSTTIRISDEDKVRLKRLQDSWRSARGERPAQEELIGKVLGFVERHRHNFIAESTWRALKPSEIESMRRLQGHYGDTAAERTDEIVYGDGA
jgi:hypothetical protein